MGTRLKIRYHYLHAEMNVLRSVCVYCGSSAGTNPIYREDAIRLAQMLAQRKIRLINGGGNIGLMGIMADTILVSGGECTGVIPMGLRDKELAHNGMTELILVPDMHSRKLTMVNLADAFIAFPGGFGTLDELFETLTWSQLHLHQKPIIVYNPNHYFDPLLQQADRMMTEGFLNKSSRSLLMSTDKIDDLITMLSDFQPSPVEKWTPIIDD